MKMQAVEVLMKFRLGTCRDLHFLIVDDEIIGWDWFQLSKIDMYGTETWIKWDRFSMTVLLTRVHMHFFVKSLKMVPAWLMIGTYTNLTFVRIILPLIYKRRAKTNTVSVHITCTTLVCFSAVLCQRHSMSEHCCLMSN